MTLFKIEYNGRARYVNLDRLISVDQKGDCFFLEFGGEDVYGHGPTRETLDEFVERIEVHAHGGTREIAFNLPAPEDGN